VERPAPKKESVPFFLGARLPQSPRYRPVLQVGTQPGVSRQAVFFAILDLEVVLMDSNASFALVEEDGPRVWLFTEGRRGGSPVRGLDGTWSKDGIIMPDELGEFRYATASELSTFTQEAAAALRDIPSRSNAAEKASS
tara:strand:- start:1557 stop:1973 length:417 start_codon:yes stop_codon:yes gene_type:complete